MSEFKKETQFSDRETKERRTVNLLSDFDGALKAIAEVEGAGWLDWIREMRENPSASKENLPWFVLEKLQSGSERTYSINGMGASNRYKVEPDGSIGISALHANNDPQILERARQAGFKIR